ncbi:sodium transporter [Streptococcus saliviloxodontae]|uniref:Sodium transporter n=1 Tax=Streptococcus saliviloxodontae TaxID=1349416 RepID=A0ABS2PM90_9STRE|nr:sodium transporter [Streptococcus saliviloxodontae]MBM7636115.1 hypothetical protein [Streptococcus saliviloxodontae]
MKEIMNHLPYKLAYYDAQGKLVFDNGGTDGTFFREIEPEDLPEWICQELRLSETGSLQLQLPSDAFDKILFAHYQVARQDDGTIIGFSETIFDFREALSSYLNETGQAIVGWSDVTSGASIKNDLFDDM